MSPKLRVLIASSEAVPFSKTGGLADVVGALASELRRQGVEVSLILPLHRETRKRFKTKPLGLRISVPLDRTRATGRLHKARGPGGVPVYFIEKDSFFDRDGLYGDRRGDYWDNSARYTFFSRGVLEAAQRLELAPQVIHCHDWQTSLIPLYMKTLYKDSLAGCGSVFTIHNLGYQGLFWHWDMPLLGLGWEYFDMNALEFYGKVNFMKAGILFADKITVVSPTHAREVMTPEFGFGLDSLLKVREPDLSGILNGIDTARWDPSHGEDIPAKFDPGDLRGKAVCRSALRKECGLVSQKGVPLLAFVGRMAGQKGVHEVLRAVALCARQKLAQFVLLGSGDPLLEQSALDIAATYPGWGYVRVGFDEGFARRVYAGADIFLMPSRYEPCGLSQMIAMHYGTIPVVRRTGGLADTVFETGEGANGFVFSGELGDSFIRAVKRAIRAYSEGRSWKALVRTAMRGDFSWSARVPAYLALYRELAGRSVVHVA